nr:HD domain-containing protein [Duganella sp. BJB1802]
MQDAAIDVMVSLAEFRDETTGSHVRRTSEYVRLLAAAAWPPAARRAAQLTPETIGLMVKSAPLHDIGKDRHPRPHPAQARQVRRSRTEVGRHADPRAAQPRHPARAGDQMGVRGRFLATAMQIAGSHHEKWDGSGYPEGACRRGHSAGRAPDSRGRRVRRAGAPPVQRPMPASVAAGISPGTRHPLRPVNGRLPACCHRFERVALRLADAA